MLSRKTREAINAYLMIGPWLLGFVLWIAGPMVASLVLSFMDWSLMSPPAWSGLGNFQEMLKDDLFWISLVNTAYYTFIGVPVRVVAALIVALGMNLKLRGISIWRTIYYMPSITPAVASAIIWMWMFNPDFGILNTLLRYVGIMTKVQWIYDPILSKPSLILMSVWGVGGQMIVLLAGLQAIPEHLYEAARIEGTNGWKEFWRITLPMLTPSIFFVTIIQIINSFQVFTAAYVMTKGGPENSTLFLVLYLFRHGFEFFHMGYASAMAWVLFLIVLVFTLIQFKLSNRWVFYEAELRR